MNIRVVSIFVAALLGCTATAQECRPYWAHIPRLVPPGFTMDLPVYDDESGPALYSFELLSPLPITVRPIKWTGREWVPMSYTYPTGSLGPFAVLDDGAGARLYSARNNNGTVETFRWDGAIWEMMPASFLVAATSTTGTVHDMYSHNDGNGTKIYGFYDLADPFIRRVVVRWDGASWTIIGSTANAANLLAMATHDDGTGAALYVCGEFSTMNGVPMRKIARWKNQTWSAVGNGLTQGPRAIVSLDMGAGPRLYTFGGEPGPNNEWQVMVWDGQSWSTIGGASAPPGTLFSCKAMAAFDDGTGPGLVVGGNFPFMGGVHVKGVARWNGQTWSAMGPGSSGGFIEKFAVMPGPRGNSLLAIGAERYGGGQLGDIGQWVGCPNCYANCDLSTTPPTLNVADFICFINKFAARDPYANCTVDATIDVADFVCFMSKFAAGCP